MAAGTVSWELFHYSLSVEQLQHLSPDDIIKSCFSADQLKERLAQIHSLQFSNAKLTRRKNERSSLEPAFGLSILGYCINMAVQHGGLSC